jgi:hypothetical protein
MCGCIEGADHSQNVTDLSVSGRRELVHGPDAAPRRLLSTAVYAQAYPICTCHRGSARESSTVASY